MKSLLIPILVIVCIGCDSEPKSIVGGSSSDGRYKLTLEATNDWVRPGGTLPIKVRLERLGTQLVGQQETVTITLSAYNGGIEGNEQIDWTFAGAIEDVEETEDGEDATQDVVIGNTGSVFEEWIEFVPSTRISVVEQGEISALFEVQNEQTRYNDHLGHVKLIIRIVPAQSM